MFKIILILIFGILTGSLLRKKTNVIRFTEKLTFIVICILLALLGISVGANKEIIQNFASIGFKSIVITCGALTGSIFLSYLVYKFVFKDNI